ncbi:hypothetical protein HOY82DRAFT_599019 [Tuber indicum]|nr:hypothetical protein HOY82DRAFT_599019 [Tuber indicum]
MNSNHVLHASISNTCSEAHSTSYSQSRSSISGENGSQQSIKQCTPPYDSRKRGAAWQPWEDRALVQQVQADDPILGQLGRKEERWSEVSKGLTRYGMSRSWSSCKDRMEKLIQWHKKAETRSKQKTGTDEEVTAHIKILDDITLRYESLSKNFEIRQLAKTSLEKKREEGKKLRQCSLEGLVRKRSLESHKAAVNHRQQGTDIDEDISPTPTPK